MGSGQKFISSNAFQFLVGRRNFSLLMGWLADRKAPQWLLQAVIRKYVTAFQIDTQEYVLDDGSITSFNAFFTRKFKPGKRQFADGIASPVEGAISAFGTVSEGALYQVKGSEYSLDHLLQTDGSEMGSFITIYLSPADYHRIHFPFDCTVNEVRHISGDRFSVSMEAIASINSLYCKNERVVLSGTCEYGKFHLVLVGAVIVGKMTVTPIPEFKPGYHQSNLQLQMKKGDEAGAFLLGSTIILVFEKDQSDAFHFLPDQKVKLGEKLF